MEEKRVQRLVRELLARWRGAQERHLSGEQMTSRMAMRPTARERMVYAGRWQTRCWTPEGRLRWEASIENLIVNVGLDYALDVALSGGIQSTTWFIGLINATPTFAASDTMASHAGWTESTAYSQTTRPAWVDGGVSGQSVSNVGSPAVFSITAAATIAGAFLTSNSTKGGTTGTLYAEGAFTEGNRSVVNGDTLQVTATFTNADDGV